MVHIRQTHVLTAMMAVSFCATVMPLLVSRSGATDRTSPVSVGAMAPDFTLEAQDGHQVTLSQERGQASVVLVFYRGSWWPYCGRQVAELRLLLHAHEPVRLYAISVDSPAESKLFAEKIAADGKGAVNFPLLADPGHQVIDAYGLHDPAYDGQKGDGIPHPALYVIDTTGRVAWAKVEPDYRQRPTNSELRAVLDALQWQPRDGSQGWGLGLRGLAPRGAAPQG